MEAFLKKVARAYIENESDNLVDYCFVFPNKRSGIFFGKYIEELISKPTLLPDITAISNLIADFSTGTEASRYELLFILYNIYKSCSNDITEFDQFQFWGDVILNDFNDVDKYLVDAKQLFINVRRLKEINSNYLTAEQIEIINKYWGENRQIDGVDRFWKHLDNNFENGLPRDRFLKLWEILYDLYERFNVELTNRGLSYSGRSYREALTNITHTTIDKLSYKRYIFIGFNVLSTSELRIFERLQEFDCADFYWDYNSPAYTYESNKASRFLKRYVRLFPSRYNIGEDKIEQFPNIEIKGISSNVGQVKEASQILRKLLNDKQIKNPDNAIDTAVILPDENLFIPLIHSFPQEFTSVNITMGYPMRFTPISALIKTIVSMQLRARMLKGEWVFYYEDVQSVLSQPLIRTIAFNECELIQNHIANGRVFNLSSDFLVKEYPILSQIFTPVRDINNFDEVFEYTLDLIEFIKNKLLQSKHSSIDVAFLSRYKQALLQLRLLVDEYSIEMHEHTFFHLIERTIASDTVNFEGEPLKGLQIMGVLETRALDFENVILLSMNERVFPRKHYTRSFIPDALRRGYGMSTIEFQESIYAYYFYRLLSRAKNVFLLYDARTSGIKSGEMSRYLYQLRFLYPQKTIKFGLVDYEIHSTRRDGIEIAKTIEVMEKLNQYRTKDSGKALSASAIKKYVHCPLQFYLEIIEGIRIEDEVKEYMDDITYGNIFHAVAEKIYKSLVGNVITETVLERVKNSTAMLSTEITKAVNYHYNKLGKDNETPLFGEAKVLAEIMLYSIKDLLEEEKKFVPIRFKSAEEKMEGTYTVSPDLTINIKLFIDRVDSAVVNGEEQLRIVDYKTGGDDTSIISFSDIFDNSNSNNNGAILQMFVYCNFYSNLMRYEKPIQPIIYKLRTLKTTGLKPLMIGYGREKRPVYDYREFNDEFLTHFHLALTDMFNPDVPFVQTRNDKNCKYCSFKNICGKE